jgi:hypothetical protein
MDVRGYSYFMERRASDKRWVATVAEFPELSAESRIHNRALYALHDQVSALVAQRLHAGEPVPEAPRKMFDLEAALKRFSGER